MAGRNKNGKTFGVIGYGRFGRLWARELRRFGTVYVHDSEQKLRELPRGVRAEGMERSASADMVFFCVPISKLERVLFDARRFVRTDAIVLDVCSVKMGPTQTLRKAFPKGPAIIGSHPLFGPDSARMNGGLAGLKIALCPVRAGTREKNEALSLFRKLKLRVVVTTPRAHDESMAPSQALVHLIGRALGNFHLKPREIATPDYTSLVRIAEIVGNDTWELFSDMQRENPYADRMREKFVENLGRIQSKLIKDRDGLPELRRSIGRVDRKIISLLAAREDISRKIGTLKVREKKNILDRKRERELARVHVRCARSFGVHPELVKEIFRSVVRHSKKLQKML